MIAASAATRLDPMGNYFEGQWIEIHEVTEMEFVLLFGALAIACIAVLLFQCIDVINAYEDLIRERVRQLRLRNDKLEAEFKPGGATNRE
ncbi:hypothetical protein PY650_18525 [Rhizobium calliandrae]|uniref:Transmembrane protein n=1 Tax=Rhizobium calliandrae TaxID=1312182 RepID=A0ABT7KG70_9HYPH|nr:hypothetical protein [Rhizobium calliandrae]MDL2407620.1 hypothetical protein [Rhizobium calliandrae]